MRRPRADDHRTQTREIGRTAPSHFLIFSCLSVVTVSVLLFSWSFTVHTIVFWKIIPSAWEERPPQQHRPDFFQIFPKTQPPCPRKGVSTFADKNRLVLGLFLSLGAGPPLFTITTVLLDTLVCHKLNEIGRLALQQSAQSFKVLPRHTLLVSELLQGGLAEKPLCPDFVGIVAFFF